MSVEVVRPPSKEEKLRATCRSCLSQLAYVPNDVKVVTDSDGDVCSSTIACPACKRRTHVPEPKD